MSEPTNKLFTVVCKEDGELWRYNFKDEHERNEFKMMAEEDGTYWGVEGAPWREEYDFREKVKR